MAIISQFDMKRVQNSNSAIHRTQNIIKSVVLLYNNNHNDLKQDLSQNLQSYIKSMFENEMKNASYFLKRVKLIEELVKAYGLLTLETIAKYFANFALQTWCPIFSQILLKIALPYIKTMTEDCTCLEQSTEFHELTFNLFKESVSQIHIKSCE